MGDGSFDTDTPTDSKDDIPIIISDDENNGLPPLVSTYNETDLINFKLADIAMRFGPEKRNLVETQMLNLCISFEKRLLQKQL